MVSQKKKKLNLMWCNLNLTNIHEFFKKFVQHKWFSFSVDWVALPRLELIDMSENDFTRIVRPSIWALSALKYLFLTRNQLNGSLPTQGMYLIKFYVSIFFFFYKIKKNNKYFFFFFFFCRFMWTQETWRVRS